MGSGKENIGEQQVNFQAELKKSCDEMKAFMTSNLLDVKEEISEKLKKQQLSSLFKCVICYKITPHSYQSCLYCGRFLGCFTCISQLDKCPTCRKNFNCSTCSTSFPKTPLFIPGIEEVLELPQVTRRLAPQEIIDNQDEEVTGSTLE